MPKATELVYTENELIAIETLRNNAGSPLSAAQLGVKPAVLTSLAKKAADERPMANGAEKVVLHKEDREDVCPTCGAKHSYKVYWID